MALQLPHEYVQLPGSERKPIKGARIIGPGDQSETFEVTIVLRRRLDGPPIPDFDYYAHNPPGSRTILSPELFADEYGAHPLEIEKVIKFLKTNGLSIIETHAGRRTVKASGTNAQMSLAFGVTLDKYEYVRYKTVNNKNFSYTATYRGRNGYIHLPKDLVPIIIGVFGLDNRSVRNREKAWNQGDPLLTQTLSVQEVTQLYNFPNPGPSINNVTIGIVSASGGANGYLASDVEQYFSSIGKSTPANIFPISIDGTPNGCFTMTTTEPTPILSTALHVASVSNLDISLHNGFMLVIDNIQYEFSIKSISAPGTINFTYISAIPIIISPSPSPTPTPPPDPGTPVYIPRGTTVYFGKDQETIQDICIAASAAPGANIDVLFCADTQKGWIDLLSNVILPDPSQFPEGVSLPSVITSSYPLTYADDPGGLSDVDQYEGLSITQNTLSAMDLAFQDAAINGITICAASGDNGTQARIFDYLAHVPFPASDPWVIGVGGTTIGRYLASYERSSTRWVEYLWNDDGGAIGGGISDCFPLPSYQKMFPIPENINLTLPNGSAFNSSGRGVPDVAANASPNSGYPMFNCGQPIVADGTSASSPLWAGLIAVLNSNLGYNLGFINPQLYAAVTLGFNPINPLWPDPNYPQLASAPSNNAYYSVPGYPAREGWDACTGLGSPNGMALLHQFQSLSNAEVYVLGGYQSPSILITDPDLSPPNNEVNIGDYGNEDTWLQPGKDYNLAALVTNDSPVTASSVEVKFWAIPGGAAVDGYMIGNAQTVSIPAYSTVAVNASAPFKSAPAFGHVCVAVSLFSPTTGCMIQPLDAIEIPAPGQEGSHSCVAFRNTDSFITPISIRRINPKRIKFPLTFGSNLVRTEQPILIKVESTLIPHHWEKLTPVAELQSALDFFHVSRKIPLFLLPQIKRLFDPVDLQPLIHLTSGGRISASETSPLWRIYPNGGETVISIQLELPDFIQQGDMVQVKISAQYPDSQKIPSRTVEFYEYVKIVGE
jgi:hypothetical protein